MDEYRSLCLFLRREFKQFRVSIRRMRMSVDYGNCNMVGGRFYISVNRKLCEGGAILCVLHEFGHVLSWHDDKAPSQHGPAFGRAYHEVWEAYLRYLDSENREGA